MFIKYTSILLHYINLLATMFEYVYIKKCCIVLYILFQLCYKNILFDFPFYILYLNKFSVKIFKGKIIIID